MASLKNKTTSSATPPVSSSLGSGLFLLRRCLEESGLALFSFLALLFATATNLLFPILIKMGIDESHGLSLIKSPVSFLGILTLLFIFQGVFFFLRSYLFGSLGHRVTFRLRCEVFQHLLFLPASQLDLQRVGDLVSRLNTDSLLVQDAVCTRLSVFVRYLVQSTLGLILMFYLSPYLTLFILLTVPVLLAISMVLGKQLKTITKQHQGALGAASSLAEEVLSQLKIVKVYNAEEREGLRFAQTAKVIRDTGIRRVRVSAILQSFVPFLLNVALAGFLLIGLSLLESGALTMGDLTSFILYAAIVAVSISFVMGGVSELVQALAALERILEFTSQSKAPPLSVNSPKAVDEKSYNQPLYVKDVSFFYPSRPEMEILSRVSFRLDIGTTTALVGASGGGKSTIAELILGFYEPSAGCIEWGETPVKAPYIHQLRRYMAYVPQEPMLFHVTIAENLRIARPEADDEELYAALRLVNLDSFVRSLPDKLETVTGEKGVQLSGGQKQRLAIARALLRKPKLLILDEATSALDSENERLICEALRPLRSTSAILLISHRPSTIAAADHVLVLENGKVVESGTHQSLQEHGGHYAQFASRQ